MYMYSDFKQAKAYNMRIHYFNKTTENKQTKNSYNSYCLNVIKGYSVCFPACGSQKAFFSRNPEELQGDFLKVRLQKNQRLGFGIAIAGGLVEDEEAKQRLLQIKTIKPNGPAHTDGQLRTGRDSKE